MRFKKWVEENYDELYTITRNITSNSEYTDDLFQEVMLQLLPKKMLDNVPDNEKKYFFISVVRLNYFSKTSRFYYNIKKPTERWFSFDERDENLTDEEYIHLPDMEWVNDQLKDLHWYKRTLFELWVEQGSITKLSEKTTISKNTCGQQIRDIKEYLQDKWNEKDNE